MILSWIQWVGIALIIGYVAYQYRGKLVSLLPKGSEKLIDIPIIADSIRVSQEPLSEMMARLAQLQQDLEDRGCNTESKVAGTWYALLRKPIIKEVKGNKAEGQTNE